jgi:hypothetical protein
MVAWGVVFFGASICSPAWSANEPGAFSGEWKTTLGPVTFEQKGQEVTGQIIAFKLPVRGKLEGKTLVAGYDEGQIHVDAKLELDAAGTAFKGVVSGE